MDKITPDSLSHIPSFKTAFTKGYTLTKAYPYYDQYGISVLYWRVRLDHPEKPKFIRPVHQNGGENLAMGEPEWIKASVLKPLYNQHMLYKYPKAQAWIVEGEKCADILNDIFDIFGIFGDHIAITSGSATSGEKADLKMLEGRSITIWPDNDPEGQKYASILYHRLSGQAASVQILDVSIMGLQPKEDCENWFDRNPTATKEQLLSLTCILPPKQKSEVEIIKMSDLEMKPVNWLWPDRIACGKVTVIAGNPGLGKSQITAMLAAHVTQGYAFPDLPDDPVKIGSVIFLSAEDDPADTILPRLKAAEADTTKCFILEAIRTEDPQGKEHLRGFDLSQDIDRLRSVLHQVGDVRLIIIDPVSAYLGKTKDNNNAEMRGLLAPLSTLAAEIGAAVVLVTHLNKSTTQDAIGRVIGSIGLIAAARAGYSVSKDPKNPDIRYLVPLKNNIGNDQDGFSFTIQGVPLTTEIKSSRIIWGDSVDAQKILYPTDDKPSQINGASDFLRELLGDGPKSAQEIFAEGDGAGYSKATLRRAKQRLGIKHRKMGMNEGWEWYFPLDVSGFKPGFLPEDTEDHEGVEDNIFLSVVPSENLIPTP